MYCRRCGNEIFDSSMFCERCGEAVRDGEYPEIKGNFDDNEIFGTVYFGPDYYKDSDEDEGLKDGEKKRGLQKLTGWLTGKNKP